MFDKSQRSTFPYWFAHWCAYQMTALNLGCWKFRFLFHDIWKPWQMLLYRNYSKVQKKHRHNNKHHISYWADRDFDDSALHKLDYLGMVIDWECSRYTKKDAQLNAYDTLLIESEKLRKGSYDNYTDIYIISPTEEQIQYFTNHITEILTELKLIS